MNDASQHPRRRPAFHDGSNLRLRRLNNPKKRPRAAAFVPSLPGEKSNHNTRGGGGGVLSGVTACLSGFDIDSKDQIHAIISSLGGNYSRDLDPKYVTHLILDEPKGPKYEYVMSARKGWAKKIVVVTSAWVEACKRERRRVREDDYCNIDGKNEDTQSFDEKDIDKRVKEEMVANGQPVSPNGLEDASLEEACELILQRPTKLLFSCQNFLLVGFEDDSLDCLNDVTTRDTIVDSSRLLEKKKTSDNSSSVDKINLSVSTKERISRLIRRAGGTIYWESNELISIVVISDICSKDSWDDAQFYCKYHPRGPVAVNVGWIINSLYNQRLELPCLPSLFSCAFVSKNSQKTLVAANNTRGTKSPRVISNLLKSAANEENSQERSSVFQGDIFAIVRLKPPPGTLDFNPDKIESMIAKNGGFLLSKEIFNALRYDLQNLARNFNAESGTMPRKYYVVSTGGYHLDHANFHPLLADLSKLGVTITPVTPVWVMACVSEKTRYSAENHPFLFQPHTWPIRLLNPPSPGQKEKFNVSVTGFLDASRYGIIYLLKAIGANYTDNLRASNTHLICKEAKGAKYSRAIDWGLYVVSLEWLCYVVRYGYEEDCESKFSLKNDSKSQSQPISSKSLSGIVLETSSNKELVKEVVVSKGNNSAELKKNPVPLLAPSAPVAMLNDSVKTDKPIQAIFQESPIDRSRRLQSALESLQAPAGGPACEGNAKPNILQGRSRRRHASSPPTNQAPPDSQEDEDDSQKSTQLSIRVDDEIEMPLAENHNMGGVNVPLAEDNDEEGMGESQIVWFATNTA